MIAIRITLIIVLIQNLSFALSEGEIKSLEDECDKHRESARTCKVRGGEDSLDGEERDRLLQRCYQEEVKAGEICSKYGSAKEQLSDIKQTSKECQVSRAVMKYCMALTHLKKWNRIIANEKEVGKASGFVNATVLRNAGSEKLGWEEWKKEALKILRKHSKEKINEKQCNIKDINDVDAEIDQATFDGFDKQIYAACGEPRNF